jgi:hypothetical protein
MSICIVDTSIFCNILEVPNLCQDRDRVLNRLEELIEDGATLLLPLATIYETGNHIAQNGDGRERRNAAERFAEQVNLALQGENPFTPTDINEEDELRQWLAQFPDYAEREVGFGDMSIIEAFYDQCDRHPSRRVFIWAIDSDLSNYDREPTV